MKLIKSIALTRSTCIEVFQDLISMYPLRIIFMPNATQDEVVLAPLVIILDNVILILTNVIE